MKKELSLREKEMKMRTGILNLARTLKCEEDVKTIYKKYDKLLDKCTNLEERKQIGIMALVELHTFLDCSGALIIDGVEILPASEESRKLPEIHHRIRKIS